MNLKQDVPKLTSVRVTDKRKKLWRAIAKKTGYSQTRVFELALDKLAIELGMAPLAEDLPTFIPTRKGQRTEAALAQ